MNKRKLWLIMAASLVVLAAAGTYVGWTVAGEPLAKSSALPTSSPPHPDPNGKLACSMVETAFEDDHSWNDHLLIREIFKAAAAAKDTAISGASGDLGLRLALASGAQGKPDQPQRDRDLYASLKELERLCKTTGL